MADLSYGFSLPNYGNPVEALQEAGKLNERKQERAASLAERQKKEAQDDIWKRTKLVEDETNPEKIATGDITADQYLAGQTKQVMQSILSDPNFKSLPPNELYGMIQNKWLPVIHGAAALKDRLAQSDALAIAHGQKDSNINTGLLKQDLRASAINSVLKADANGQLQFKPDDIYNPNDTAANLMNSDNSAKYIISGKPMIDYIKGYKGDKFKFTKSLGDKSIIKYEGEVSPFKKLNVTPDANGSIEQNVNPELQVNAEAYPSIQRKNADGTTRPAMLLNDDVFEQHFANQSGFKKLWNDHKKEAGVQPQTRQEENILQREYAAKLIEDNDKSGILYDRQHLPSNKTIINNNTGDKAPQVRDIYKEITGALDDEIKNKVASKAPDGQPVPANSIPLNKLSPAAQEFALDVARKVKNDGVDNDLTQDDIFIMKSPNGGLNIMKYATGKDGFKLIAPFQYTDANFKGQAGVKEKRKVVEVGNKMNNNKAPESTPKKVTQSTKSEAEQYGL